MTRQPSRRRVSALGLLLVGTLAASGALLLQERDDVASVPPPKETTAADPVVESAQADMEKKASKALEYLTDRIHENAPQLPVVTEEISRRGEEWIPMWRLNNPGFKHLIPDELATAPTFVIYPGLEVAADSDDGRNVVAGVMSAAITAVDLMEKKEIAVNPVVVYFAVKPGRKVRTWAVGLHEPLSTHDRDLLNARTSDIPVPALPQTVVIGVVYPRRGQTVNAFELPIPEDWMAAIERAKPRQLSVPRQVVAAVWPD